MTGRQKNRPGGSFARGGAVSGIDYAVGFFGQRWARASDSRFRRRADSAAVTGFFFPSFIAPSSAAGLISLPQWGHCAVFMFPKVI
jgi:hypothetical protein